MLSGPEQLRDWMDRRFPGSSRKQRDTAEHFDWDETFIAKLLSGVRKPGLDNALRIELETGIPVEAWVSSEVDETEETVPVGSEKHQAGRTDKRHARK